jgi:hypothetical protein
MGAFGNYPQPQKFQLDLSDKHPVSVVTSFTTDGRFIPLYFKYEAEDQQSYTYKINNIKYFREYEHHFLFSCLYNNGRNQYEVLLSFWTEQCVWTISA